MAKDTLLVTGIHREELGFGDRVAALVDPACLDVMRIPSGIPRASTGPSRRFYSTAQHREIYLQLHQQVKGHYRLLIDLHRGLDEAGRSAEVFCHDEAFLSCLGARLEALSGDHDIVHLVRIVATGDRGVQQGGAGIADGAARTWIPPRIWQGRGPLYVGLEVYLPTDDDGYPDDWRFAHRLIDAMRACAPE